MLETNETADLLQKTYLPEGESGYSGFKNPDTLYDTKRCDLTNVRWNSGDDLFGESDSTPISGTLSYKAAFSCTFGPLDISCEKEVPVALSIYNRTPKGDELWDRLVAGDMAIFKRIYPAEFFTLPREILDLPGVTSAKYTSTADKTLAGDPAKQRPGDKAEFYIPHLGGIQEYFLKGIQKALRPKGFSDQIPPSPPPTGTGQCSPLAYDIDYRNTSILPKPKEEVINLIKSRFPGNQIAKYYDTVVNRSTLAGYNPAFVMAIWIEETGASDYGQFGTDIYDFGCGAAPKGNFSAQLDCFLGLYDYWSAGSPDNSLFSSCREGGDHPNFEDFMLYFAEGICTTIEKQNRQFCGSHSNFPTKFRGFYNMVVAP